MGGRRPCRRSRRGAVICPPQLGPRPGPEGDAPFCRTSFAPASMGLRVCGMRRLPAAQAGALAGRRHAIGTSARFIPHSNSTWGCAGGHLFRNAHDPFQPPPRRPITLRLLWSHRPRTRSVRGVPSPTAPHPCIVPPPPLAAACGSMDRAARRQCAEYAGCGSIPSPPPAFAPLVRRRIDGAALSCPTLPRSKPGAPRRADAGLPPCRTGSGGPAPACLRRPWRGSPAPPRCKDFNGGPHAADRWPRRIRSLRPSATGRLP